MKSPYYKKVHGTAVYPERFSRRVPRPPSHPSLLFFRCVQNGPLFSMVYTFRFGQVLSFDIDMNCPGGWGGILGVMLTRDLLKRERGKNSAVDTLGSAARAGLLRIGQIIERIRRRTRLPVGYLLAAAGAEVVQASTQQAHGWQYQPAPTGGEQGRAPQPKLAEGQRQAEQVPKKRKVVSVKPASPAERAAPRLKSTPAAKPRALEPRPARSASRLGKRGSAGPGIAESSVREMRPSGIRSPRIRVEGIRLSRRAGRGRASLPGPIPGTRRRPRRTIRARRVGKARRAARRARRRRVTRPRHVPREAATQASRTSGTRCKRRPIGAEGGTRSRCTSREGAPLIEPTPRGRRGEGRPIRAEVPTGRATHSRCKGVSAVPERSRGARRIREAARRTTAASGVARVPIRPRRKSARTTIRTIGCSARRSGVTARKTTAVAGTAANTETTRARSTGPAETATARAVGSARSAETLSAAMENTARPTAVRAAAVGAATAMMRATAMRAAAFRVSTASVRSVWGARQQEHENGREREFQEGGFAHGFHRPHILADRISSGPFVRANAWPKERRGKLLKGGSLQISSSPSLALRLQAPGDTDGLC
jgi:hypothetical protein